MGHPTGDIFAPEVGAGETLVEPLVSGLDRVVGDFHQGFTSHGVEVFQVTHDHVNRVDLGNITIGVLT